MHTLLSPTAAAAHSQHRKFHQRIADAADRHAENIHSQRASAKAAMDQAAMDQAAIPKTAVDPENSLEAWVRMHRQMWSRPEVLAETPAEKSGVEIRKIQQVVCEHYGVSRLDMVSDRGTHDILLPRQIAMYLAKQMTIRSLAKIGRQFGGRDHSTVYHAVRKVERLIECDATLSATVAALKAALA